MTYDDWKTRSDRDEYPCDDDCCAPEDDEPQEKQVTTHKCDACGGTGLAPERGVCIACHEMHLGACDCPVCLGSGSISDRVHVQTEKVANAGPVADVLRRDKPCKASDGPCVYCGREASGFYLVPEPTERSTYAMVWRVLCKEDWNEYKDVPYGFHLEPW